MKKLDKKGMTLIEVIVSIALISIVLIFLMNLFLNVRRMYNTSKINADFDMQISRITKAVGDDIDKYGLYCLKNVSTSEFDGYLLIFDEMRETKPADRIKKLLYITSVTSPESHKTFDMISYGYDVRYTKDIVNYERLTKVTSEIPTDALLGTEIGRSTIELGSMPLSNSKNAIELKIPMLTSSGTDYSINIFGIASKNELDVSTGESTYVCSEDEIARYEG